jgi:uncharacterized RDD family membrane protein YckC
VSKLSTSSSLPYKPSQDAAPSWKQEVNERLAAHRTRRANKASDLPTRMATSHSQEEQSRAAKVAARVAARYANAPTYSELLAQEARNAARAASAAADAAREAHAAAQAILQGLDLQPERPIEREVMTPLTDSSSELDPEPVLDFADNDYVQTASEQLHPALLEPKTVLPPPDFVPRQTAPEAIARPRDILDEVVEHTVVTHEMAFVEPAEAIPGNLIEFPRMLIAPQKARPRIAEGPLREGKKNVAESEQSQLSIFEAETEKETSVEAESPLPTKPLAEWSSIQLDARPSPVLASGISSSVLDELPLATASLEDRLMAGLVDIALVGFGFLAFVVVFVACSPHLPSGKSALIATGGILILFHLLYQYMFFVFAAATPGMRYAHIALCTFDDENPTREQMRKRIPATLLSLAAMGLGFLWALFDEDHLSWHDRLTRTYQRSYR